MKVFINNSSRDRDLANYLRGELLKYDIEVNISTYTKITKSNDDDFKPVFIRRQPKGSYDLHIHLISNDFFKSKVAIKDLNENIINNKKIIILVVDDVSLPEYLSSYINIKIKIEDSEGISYAAKQILNSLNSGGNVTSLIESNKLDQKAEVVDKIRNALESGNLTLVCGAGVSLEAGIPVWDKLLDNLFSEMLEVLKNENEGLNYDILTIKESQITNSVPALILAKYIKNNIKNKFNESLRKALYKNKPTSSELISAIAELARPRRDGKSIDSIITFNFDGLIEEQLEKERISFKAIHSEAIKFTANEIAVYHVHGYLPREGVVDPLTEIVFSEDGYHSQFIEPFSWSNIIQLQKLTQNICLFIGISLTDPNMRRLLDVAWRKNPDSALSHFIVKKKPNITSTDAEKFIMFMEEQDANELGLNVIWVDSYEAIPSLIRSFLI